MRDLNIITVSGMINQDPIYKENKEDSRKTLLHYNIIVYTGRDFYVGEELVHERFYLNCASYGEAAIKLAKEIKKGTYVQVSGKIKPNNYKKEDGTQVYSFRIMADVCIPMENYRRMEDSENECHKGQNLAADQKQSQRSYDQNAKQQSKDPAQDVMEANTSMPPRRRAAMPMTQESDQPRAMKDQSLGSEQHSSQSQRSTAGNKTQTQRSDFKGSGNFNNRSNMQMNQNQHEFENLAPEKNPFNMASVGNDDFENPYGDGNLPNPNDPMSNKDY